MKKIFRIIFIAVFSAIGFKTSSQTLTASEFPQIGDTIYYDQGDTAAALPIGGSGVTWDYSTIKKGAGKSKSIYAAPTGTSAITGDNITETQTTGGAPVTIHYFRNSNQLVVRGIEATIQSQGLVIAFTNDEIMAKFPVALYTTNSDLFAGTFKVSIITGYHQGGVFSEGFGTGTLKLPGVTFNNSILLHIKQDYTDSVNAVVYKVHNRTITNDYMWFVPGIRGAVCKISVNTNIPDTGITTETKNMWYMHQWAVGLNQISSVKNVTLFPNPANENVYVLFENSNHLPVCISITDIAGHEVKNILISTNENTDTGIPIRVSELNAGIYFIRVNEKVYKFVKE